MITDFSDVAALQAAIYERCESLERMRDEYAAAQQVVEYDADRRKAALAVETVKFLDDGEGAGASEARARASAGYFEAMKVLAVQLTAANRVIAKYRLHLTTLDALRSILSTQRSLIKEL